MEFAATLYRYILNRTCSLKLNSSITKTPSSSDSRKCILFLHFFSYFWVHIMKEHEKLHRSTYITLWFKIPLSLSMGFRRPKTCFLLVFGVFDHFLHFFSYFWDHIMKEHEKLHRSIYITFWFKISLLPYMGFRGPKTWLFLDFLSIWP